MSAVVYFVGERQEVEHHAAPLLDRLPIQIATPAEVLTLAKRGDLAVFYSEHFDRFRNACRSLRQRSVATLYMIDGILEWRNAWENRPDEVACPFTMRPVLADKVACIGASQTRTLDAWGNAAKTETVGIPRLDQLHDKKTRRPADDRPSRILVMTAKTPAFTESQWRIVRQSLQDLQRWHQSTLLDVELVWRLTGGLDRELQIENRLDELSGVELSKLLEQVDAVVTTPSTAVLEAMLMKLPVALLDYHHCPHYVQTGWDISAADQIDDALRDMLSGNPRRMLFQQQQLCDALQCEVPAVERWVQLAEGMLSIAAQWDAPGPLQFPVRMLPPLPGAPAMLDPQQVYPGTPEFHHGELQEVQAEWAHARREIEHLQRELAQVRSELDEAHQIFETIHQHPIAGPVVRMRQKMLDWLHQMRRRKQQPTAKSPPATSFGSPKLADDFDSPSTGTPNSNA